jgi:hypothetical protein
MPGTVPPSHELKGEALDISTRVESAGVSNDAVNPKDPIWEWIGSMSAAATATARAMAARPCGSANPFGDGRSGERIVAILFAGRSPQRSIAIAATRAAA